MNITIKNKDIEINITGVEGYCSTITGNLIMPILDKIGYGTQVEINGAVFAEYARKMDEEANQ